MNIKFPPVIDISHWIEVDDFNALDPKPWLIITKATQGEYFLDAKYAEYADGIRDAGMRLGSYHFIVPGNEIKQADWFCEIILDVGLYANEVLACDLEVAGVSLAQVKNFLDRVQSKTDTRPIIYSSELRIENLYPAGVCPAWLKAEWLWIAEYPNNPDLVNTIPYWIVPSGCSISNIALWQYTDDLIYTGIPGNNVDGDMVSPYYMDHIKLTEPGGTPPDPEPEEDMEGIIDVPERNIRNAAGGNTPSSIIGKLYKDDLVSWSRAQQINGVPWYNLDDAKHKDAAGNWQSVITLGGLTVAQRDDCWIYGANVTIIPDPDPEPGKEVTGATIRFSDGSTQEMVPAP